MSLRTLSNGHFSFTIPSSQLGKGLRPSKRAVRNSSYLVESKGAVGQDGVLCSIPKAAITTILDDVLVVKDDFPFPQIFITDALIIVCNRTSILEIVDGVLTSMIDTLTTGETWGISASGGYVYLSNGVVTVTRDPADGTYAIDATGLPKSSAVCNYNGQTIIGSPKV